MIKTRESAFQVNQYFGTKCKAGKTSNSAEFLLPVMINDDNLYARFLGKGATFIYIKGGDSLRYELD